MSDIAIDAADVEPESNARGWKYYADRINAIWKKGAPDFVRCGQYLIDAKAELQTDAFNALIKDRLAFDRSVGTKLMAIAAKPILCAHVHDLPPCWSTLYELSQLGDDVLEAKFADGTINSRMLRKDVLALKPKRKRKSTGNTDSSSETTTSQLGTVWEAASADQRRTFLDKLGRDGLCAAMSIELLADLRDHIISVTIAGASKSTSFATYATDKLHTALRCAEQPDEESTRHMIAALRCIASTAARKSITRSDIVIGQGKPRKGSK